MPSVVFSPMQENSESPGSSNGQFHYAQESGSKMHEYIEWHHENLTFEQYGYRQSGNHNAEPSALEAELNKIHASFKSKLNKGKEELEKMQGSLREKLKLLLDKKAKFASVIAAILELITAQKKEIDEIQKNPALYQSARPNIISFSFGCSILFLLSIYLWIFYSSASYSAFFRNFQVDDINVANSIFDARSIYKAWVDGVPAFVLIASMPFVFLALGYLIHKFMLMKSRLKWIGLALLIIVTFGFDFIIAFEIVKKIYDLKIANSLVLMPDYSISMAWSDINFWLIIFAGFVTYLIWGFLFDKIIEDHEKFDVVKYQIRIREVKIKELKTEEATERQKLKLLENEIDALEDRLALQGDIKESILDPSMIHQFLTGWIGFITGPFFPPAQKKDLLVRTDNVIKAFFSKHNLPSNQKLVHNETF